MFPDWHAYFHLVDKILARLESLTAMGSGDFNPEGGLIHGHVADAMHEANSFDGPAGGGFSEDVFELPAGHRFEGFVIDSGNVFGTFDRANKAQESNHGAGVTGRFAISRQGGFVDFVAGDLQFGCHLASLHWRKERNFIAIFQELIGRSVFQTDRNKRGTSGGRELRKTTVNSLHQVADRGAFRDFFDNTGAA